jgi:hypothetical protein
VGLQKIFRLRFFLICVSVSSTYWSAIGESLLINI